jgi:hypothetical protein
VSRRLTTSSLAPAAALAVALLLVAGCLHPIPEDLIEDPQVMVAKLVPESGEETLLAEARAEFYGQDMARKGKLTVMAQPPDRVRLEALTFTDDLVSVLAIEGGEFAYFERGRKDCLRGPLCAAPTVARFPLVSDPATLIRLLRGEIPLLEEPTEKKLSFSRREGLYVLELAAGEGKAAQIIKIERDGKSVAFVAMLLDGKVRAEMTFGDWRDVDGRRVPHRIRLLVQQEDLDISVAYREVEFGYEFKGNPFSFECPAGTQTRWLKCAAGSAP